jgi:hypothetical protein
MSASGSEQPTNAPEEKRAFTEYEQSETELPFDKGGVPVYVALIWVGFLAVYVIYMVMYALPDYSLWQVLTK